jgi:diketogulonate reductase-like aldo/keto reductase
MSGLRKAVCQLPRIKRDDGARIPQPGFGVWQAWNKEVTLAATEAVRVGDA